MPGQLTKEYKDKLLSAIARMEADGVPESEIRATVDEFKSKHSLPDRPASPDDYIQKPQGGAVGRFVQGAWRNLNPIPMVQGIIKSSQDAQEKAKNAGSMREAAAAAIEASPMTQLGHMVAGMLRENAAQFPKALNDFRQGHYSEAAGHTAAGLLPVIGPAAANAGEHLGDALEHNGDVAGALGETAALVLPSAVGALPEGTGKAMTATGGKLYNKALKPLRSVAERNPGKDLAEIGLEHNIPLTREGSSTVGSKIRNLETDVENAVAHSPAQISIQNATDYARKRLVEPGGRFRDLAPDRASVEGVLTDLENHPDFSSPTTPAHISAQLRSGVSPSAIKPTMLRDATAPEALALKQRLHGRVRDASWGEMASPQQEALKSVAHDLGDQIKTAVPSTREALSTQSDLLAFKDALDPALHRIGNRNPLPLEAAIHLAGGATPMRLAASLGALPRVMDVGGRALYRGGKVLTNHPVASGEAVANLMRAALLDQMRGGDEQ